MTPFEKAVLQVEAEKLQTPTVSVGSKQIDYFGYQLSVHHFNLKIMARGMTFKGIRLKDLKAYYGLTGRSAADCLIQFEAILDAYKSKPVLN